MKIGADLTPHSVFGLLQAEARARHAHLRGREILLGLVDVEPLYSRALLTSS